MKLNGTDKQIKFANDLIEKAKNEVDKFSGTKKEKLVQAEKAILPHIKEGMDAGKIIDVFALDNPNGDFQYGVFQINKGWNPEATPEKAIEYLNS